MRALRTGKVWGMKSGSDDDRAGAAVAEALGALLQRGHREHLYARLTRDVVDAVDATTYPVLSGLARVGACSAAELGLEIGLDRSGVSRRATRLEVAGLLSRSPDPSDGRAVKLELTPRGHTAVETLRTRLASEIDELLQDWTDDETRLFAAGFVRFVDSALFTK
ncbi:MAG: transcriptional regulator [Rhodococcus erythropolis]|jgi:DNA-binding MarR family transcriptional regulator|nr:MarR family transcriptional regulator [Rhodococcus erythropolis]MDF2898899.1 transcriptional regulator [Rhodococcus erythropolis]